MFRSSVLDKAASLEELAVVPPAVEDLADKVKRWSEAETGKNGFHLLKTGGDGLAARLAIIQASSKTLDLQYYMLQEDLTGKLIIEELFRAADRGVRVRVLLDDLDFGRVRDAVCILNMHENIEFRIFNPASTRKKRWFLRVTKWSKTLERYTKRMHNKALISDGHIGIIGGRNLGDEYFEVSDEFAFSDLDVLLMGPLLGEINSCFERYWDSKAAYPIYDVGYGRPAERTYQVQRIALRKFYDDVAHMKVISMSKPEDYLQGLRDESLPLIWAEADFAMDDPDKVFQPIEEADSPPMKRLEDLLDTAQHEFIAVTPYFIPDVRGMGILDKLHKKGVKFRLLTNSLASTDISAVHAVYSRYRKDLLRDGAQMHELKPIPGKHSRSNLFRRRGTSRSSLHAKVYVVDREYVMLGSMNLDPRSWLRNTETVVTLRSKDLAAHILEMFDSITHESTSYHVKLAEDGEKLEWHTRNQDGKAIIYHRDPDPGWFRRLSAALFYYIAPITHL